MKKDIFDIRSLANDKIAAFRVPEVPGGCIYIPIFSATSDEFIPKTINDYDDDDLFIDSYIIDHPIE